MSVPASSAAVRLRAGCLLAACIGAVLLIAHAALGGSAWTPSYLFAWLFVLGLSLGSMALVTVHQLTGGGWGRAARPFLDAALRMFPLAAALAVPLLFKLAALYPWMRPADASEAAQGRAWYLDVPFFSLRAMVYFVIWIALARLLLRDESTTHAHGADRGQAGRGQAVASIGLVLYAMTATFSAVDWIMSLTPQWHSTVFGLLIGVGQALAALAAAIIAAAVFAVRLDEGLRGRFHDLGKLMLALVLLWAYLAFMQFLIMWIEDLPDDIGWYLPRTHTSWAGLTLFVAAAHFALPFLILLSRNAKRRPVTLSAVAGLVLLACLADVFWMVVPTFRPQGFQIQWDDLLALLAVGGIWSWWLLRTIRMPAAEPARAERGGSLGEHAAQHA